MRSHEISAAIRSGLLAVGVMTIVSYLFVALGLAGLDYAAWFGHLLAGYTPARFSDVWFGGLIWHLGNGAILFPVLYLVAFRRVSPDWALESGVAWGIVLWLFLEGVVSPLARGGFFSSHQPQPAVTAIASLLSCLIYGVVLASRERRQMHTLRILRRAA